VALGVFLLLMGMSLTALTAADGEGDTAHPYDLYVRTVSGRNSTVILEGMFSRLQGFDPQAEGSGVSWGFNYDLMRYYGYSGESRYNNVMYSLGAILIGIIMFGSISLIYNAFSISVSERTKQFGLLASIGGTKRQLTGSVLFEALFLGCIGIPLGILSGLAGIGITFYFVKDMVGNILGIISTSYETARLIRILGPAKHVTLTMHPSLGALAIALLISLATILISAYLPMRRAMKRPAIDAIRQAGDIAIRPGKVRTSRLTQKLFGFEGWPPKIISATAGNTAPL
jgi:putative ABC transport system permease protein